MATTNHRCWRHHHHHQIETVSIGDEIKDEMRWKRNQGGGEIDMAQGRQN